METLPLPGDGDTVLEMEVRRAIRRDGRLNWAEDTAKAVGQTCGYCRRQYWDWRCTHREPCFYCETLP